MLSCSFLFWSTWFIGSRFELCTSIGCQEPNLYVAFVCTCPGDDGVEPVEGSDDGRIGCFVFKHIFWYLEGVALSGSHPGGYKD